MGRASTLPELLSLEQRHGDRFDHFNLGAFWSKFKKLPRGELGGLRDHLAPVCQQSVRMLPTLSAREVANLSHAFAGLIGSGPWESVWAALPGVALRSLVDFEPPHLANTAWTFTKAGHESAELFNAISAEVVRRRLGNFYPQALSNTAWAFAKAGHESVELFNAISAEGVHRRLSDFKEQELSNTAWAFATAGHASAELFNAISATVVRRRLGDLDPQHLSNMVWAFATAGHASAELFNAVSTEVVRRRLGNFNPQDLSSMVWAFAKAGHTSTQLFNAISATVVRRRLGDLDPQHLSNMVWAFATAGHASAELFNAVSAEVVRRRLGNFNPQDLSITAWSFAKAGHESEELFNAISAEVVRRRLGTFKPQALSNTAWAFATAGHESVELFNAISAEVVRRRLGGFEAQALANLAWAFAVFNPFSADEVFGTTIFSTRCIQLETTFSRLELSQLHQWSIWREERSAQWPGLPNSLRQACRTAFDAQGETSSLLQHKVVQEIRSCGFRVKDEHRCKSSGYSIDALITLNNGEQIAVEVDGPCHFVGRSHQKSGSTLLKHHQLRYFGWRLRSVPYWEWDADGCKALHWLPRGH